MDSPISQEELFAAFTRLTGREPFSHASTVHPVNDQILLERLKKEIRLRRHYMDSYESGPLY